MSWHGGVCRSAADRGSHTMLDRCPQLMGSGDQARRIAVNVARLPGLLGKADPE
jgi:hypothetical protein